MWLVLVNSRSQNIDPKVPDSCYGKQKVRCATEKNGNSFGIKVLTEVKTKLCPKSTLLTSLLSLPPPPPHAPFTWHMVGDQYTFMNERMHACIPFPFTSLSSFAPALIWSLREQKKQSTSSSTRHARSPGEVRHDLQTGHQKEEERETEATAAFMPTFPNSG